LQWRQVITQNVCGLEDGLPERMAAMGQDKDSLSETIRAQRGISMVSFWEKEAALSI
jgi:hypothetical protein